MKQILYSTLASIIFLFAVSCTEKIDIALESGDVRCVIYGEITTDTMAHRVKISKSADYFSNKPAEPISGANVTITDGTTIFTLIESNTEPGSYYTANDVYGIPGKTYQLTINNVDLLGDGALSSYTASSEMRPVGKLDSIKANLIPRWKIWEIQAWALEPEESKDFYMFKLSINNILYTDSLNNISATDDKFFNGSQTNGIPVLYVYEKDTIKSGDRITAELCGITEDYYNFIMEAQTMYYPQVPIFSGPPANVHSNLSNNAIGYFTAYSISRKDYIVPSTK